MSDSRVTHGQIEVAEKQAPEFGWRQGTLGAGVFLLVVSLFISAGAKGALGRLPVYIAGLAVVLVVIPAIAGVIEWLSPRKKGDGNNTSM